MNNASIRRGDLRGACLRGADLFKADVREDRYGNLRVNYAAFCCAAVRLRMNRPSRCKLTLASGTRGLA